MDANYDYITRAYRHDLVMREAQQGDHEFLVRYGWREVYREDNPGGVMVLYKRPNTLTYPRMRP